MSERDRELETAQPPGSQEAGPANATPVSRILDLQRTHGNVAVGRMIAASRALARQPVDAGVPPAAGVPPQQRIDVVPPRPGDTADMDRAIREHFQNEDWREAARVLNGFSQEDIDTRVRGYGNWLRNQLIPAADVNGGAADRIRKVAQFENAIVNGRWADAAQALNSYPDQARVPPRLPHLDHYALAWLLAEAEKANLPLAATLRTHVTPRSAEFGPFADSAIGSGNGTVAAVLLNAMVAGDRTPKLAVPPRTAPQLFDIKRGAEAVPVPQVVAALSNDPQAALIRTEGLDRTLREQIAARNWAGVTATLGSYNTDDERRARLQWFHLSEVTDLANHMRGGPLGVPSSPFFPLVEARRVEKLGQDYLAAIGANNWASAVTLLNAYNDTDLLPQAKEIQRLKGAPGVAAAKLIADQIVYRGDDNHRVRRVLAFIPLESRAVPAPVGGGGVTPGAAAGPGVAVPGGTVTAHQGATSGTNADWFGYQYTGADAQKTGWIQFLAREAEKFGSDGSSQGFVDITTRAAGQAEPRKWGTTGNPYWTIDTFGGSEPFYDAPSTVAVGSTAAGSRGAHTTTPTSTAIWDRPDINTQAQREAFDTWFWEDDVDHVVMRLRFHNYLVRGMEVLYENTMTVTWTLRSATDTPARTNRAGAGGTASRMRNAHYRALVRRFPDWSFYPHG